MSRFRLPPRVAPSPAAGEPGLQNAAARLRSAREAQAKLLDERRTEAKDDGGGGVMPPVREEPAAPESIVPDALDGIPAPPAGGARPAGSLPSGGAGKRSRKEKLVVLFRLPGDAAGRVSEIARTAGLDDAYVLKSVAKEGRAVLRELADDAGVVPFTAAAQELRSRGSEDWTFGEPMTVYVREAVLDAMHSALGDPWKVTPKATVVGAFFIAIVMRLIETRLER